MINQAWVEIRNNKLDKAVQLLKNASKSGETPNINRLLGLSFLKKDDKNCLNYFLKCKTSYETDPKFLHNLIIAYVMNNKTDEARATLKVLIQQDPGYEKIPTLKKYLSVN